MTLQNGNKQTAHLRETTSIFDEIVGNRSKVRENSEQHLRSIFAAVSASSASTLGFGIDPFKSCGAFLYPRFRFIIIKLPHIMRVCFNRRSGFPQRR